MPFSKFQPSVYYFIFCSNGILLFQEHSVNIRIFKHPTATARLLRSGQAISSGPYRSGCCVVQARLQAGIYTFVSSTFRQGEIGDYQICFHAGNFSEPIGSSSGKWSCKNHMNIHLCILRFINSL